jgi:hypothetical protein
MHPFGRNSIPLPFTNSADYDGAGWLAAQALLLD